MKIGLLPLYIALYDEKVPERHESICKFIPVIADELRKRGFEVVAADCSRVKSEFQAAVSTFEKEGCEAIATLHLAYSPSLESVDILAQSNLPIVVVDTTPDYIFTPELTMANHGIHGVQDLCNMLIRRHKPFLISSGHWRESDCLDRTAKQLKAACMAWRMNHIRVGKAGGNFDGMGDFTVPTGTFGMTVVNYTPQPEPTAAEIAAEREADKARFVWDQSVTDEGYENTIRASLKLRKWAEAEKLDAFTITFLGITKANGWNTVPFLECSKAIARGVGYAGEGDVLTAALAACVAQAFPETSFTEMFCPDWSDNRIYTSHMGEMNISLCEAKPKLYINPYVYSDTNAPAIAAGVFKAGKAVLTDLAPGPDGTFTLICAPVTYLSQGGDSPKGVRGWFRPDHYSISDFLEAYSRLGGTHHLVASYDGDITILRQWAQLMGWNFAEL